ncbi:MAG TPA: hypothetical protein VFE05_19460 [Longimicrobiaceae bacterium]|jgi:hypothetical protein|nr:hypothetical protein [Longimicrobiaceae bacterium]
MKKLSVEDIAVTSFETGVLTIAVSPALQSGTREAPCCPSPICIPTYQVNC